MLDTKDRADWESSIFDPGYLDSTPILWWPNPTDEERRLHAQVIEKHKERPQHAYTKQQLDTAWTKYQEYLGDQQDLCRQRYGMRELQEAMRRLPNVKDFYMTISNNLSIRSNFLKQAFSAGLSGACGDYRSTSASGVPQLRSFFLSMHDAGYTLQKFECGDVSWRPFRCSKSDLKALAATLSQVRKFKLQISTGMDACRRFLNIKLDWWEPTFGLELANVVGDRIWQRLTKVTLSDIETTEEHLMHFLERHRATLQRVHLDTMLLTPGEWPNTVSRMRSSLHLNY